MHTYLGCMGEIPIFKLKNFAVLATGSRISLRSALNYATLRPTQRQLKRLKRYETKQKVVYLKRNKWPFMFHWNGLKRIQFISITGDVDIDFRPHHPCEQLPLLLIRLMSRIEKSKITSFGQSWFFRPHNPRNFLTCLIPWEKYPTT